MPPADVARFLRSRTTAQLLEAAAPGSSEGILDVPLVFRDGAVLPREAPFDVLGQPGRYAAVPIMLGTNRDEAKLFLFTDPTRVRRWFGFYPVVRDSTRYAVAAEYGSRLWKAAAADEPAIRLHAAHGPGVWVYRFDWDEEPTVLGADLARLVGAAHAFEVPFVFGHFEMGREARGLWTKANEPGRTALSSAMMSYWAAFAAAGDPGTGRRGELSRWSAWDGSAPGQPTFVVLDTPGDGGIRMSSEIVTKASVVADIDRDPRLPTAGDKCAELGTIPLRVGAVTADEYARRCADHPVAEAAAR
jgi:para-nitrobenzyl esterase